jgi:hypothetical protein
MKTADLKRRQRGRGGGSGLKRNGRTEGRINRTMQQD